MSSSASRSDPARPPRTLVVGAGAIGSWVAGGLAAAGWPVTLVARGDTLSALRSGPLRITDDGTPRSVPVAAVERAGQAPAPDLTIVAVKSYDTADVAAELAAVVPDGACVLSFQNGVENPAVLAASLPRARVGGVAVSLGCQRTAPAVVVRRPGRDPATGASRDLLAGGGPGPLGAHLSAVGAALGLQVRALDDPAPALWGKLVGNAALNTVTALGRVRVGELFSHERAAELMVRIGQEVVAVAHALGIAIDPRAGERYVADARHRLPPAGGSSTLFDLEAGRRLERDALIGAVVREGARLGVPVPVSRACSALLELADPWQEHAAR